jgi:UDP-glucuronate 4-epimerase
VRLKEARLAQLATRPGFRFCRLDIADQKEMRQLFADLRPQRVLHLAAQPGVRYSLTNPAPYVVANLVGFANILEGCRDAAVEHLAYASSSSVYGNNALRPFSVHHNVDHPISLYAATKKANELMAHAYSHLFGIPATGLRYFTVYGPWGRPDMAPFIFSRAILEGRPIEVFNQGRMRRDFTYVDDIVEGTLRVLDRAAAADPAFDPKTPDPGASSAPWRVYNIGNHEPVELLHFIELLEDALGRKAVRKMMPMQPGDVADTFADVDALERDTGFRPKIPLAEGVRRFVAWYRDYYRAA